VCIDHENNGGKLNHITIRGAVRGRSFECLQFLIEVGCEFDQFVIYMATRTGDLRMFELLHQNGSELDDEIELDEQIAFIEPPLTVI